MDENIVDQTVSNIWVYLWVSHSIRSNILDLKYAVEAIARLYAYNKLEITINASNPVLTELEAVERMIEAFQNYKLFLKAKTAINEN
jgi:hypothetical protein